MVTLTREFETQQLQVGQTQLYLLKGGDGPPCLVLHGVEGHEGWLAFHDDLAQQATVYAPSHPGYGHTACPPWINSVQHQAVFYNWFVQELGLSELTLIGAGVGGWIAAHMAVMCLERLRRLVLVAPCGIKPEHAETLDIFVTPWREVIQQGFVNAESSAEYQRIYGAAPIAEYGGSREAGRTMSTRMCFRPYMYDPSLPAMLGKVRTPTLVVWGSDDRIMPLECADLFVRALPDAKQRLIENCGHFAHLDQPTALAKLVREFSE